MKATPQYRSLNSIDVADGPQKLAARKFVFGSYRIFSNVSRFIGTASDAEKGSVLYQGSKHLREQLATFLADIIQIESCSTGTTDESLQYQFEVATYLAATWHLIEIFFLEHSKNMNLEVIVWLKMNAGIPVESLLALERFRSVRNPQKLQTRQDTDIDEQALGFWDTIFGLVLEGRLNEIWDILILHGELASLISSGTGDRASADSRTLQAIHDILTSHPIALLAQQRAENCTSADSAAQSDSVLSPNIAIEFKDWKDKVSRVLQSSAPVLGRVSELATLLLLLSGDNDTLLEYARGDWVIYALCSFLYVHPPSLTRSNITQVLLVAMRSLPQIDASDIEALRAARLRKAVGDIISGNISSVLKALVEMCGWGSPLRDYGSLFGLVSTAHLTYLLAKSGSGSEGSRGLGTDSMSVGPASSAIVSELLTSSGLSSMLPNEASFVEELFLEISQRLNSLDFPIEIVAGYLHSCSLRGREYARELLPRRVIGSDKEARAVAAALRAMGLHREARAVLATRGTFWLQRNRILHVDPEAAGTGTGNVAAATAAEVVKAMTFFQEAGDTMRSEALLDRALWRCCTAAVNLSQALTHSDARGDTGNSVGKPESLPLFPRGLRLRPTRPRGAAVRGDVTSCAFMDLRHYEEYQSLSALIEQGVVLPVDAALSRLITAVSNGEQLLGALVAEQTIESCFAVSLRDYLGLIRALLVPHLALSSASESQSTGFEFQYPVHLALSSGGITGISAGASVLQSGLSRRLTHESTLIRDDERVKVLVTSANVLQRLLLQELVPIRYWIHLIDLSVSLDKAHSALLTSDTGGLFDKAQSYHLIDCAERAMILHSQYAFAQGRIHLPDPLDELNEEDAKALRTGLLEILTRAVIHANSEAGSRKRKKDNALMYPISSENRDHGIDVASDLIAFEALSASGFL